MAETKLILRIDNLSHKLVSAESEVAFGEDFDIVFDGLENAVGKTAVLTIEDISGTQVLWNLSAPIQERGGNFIVANCKIETAEALEVLTWEAVDTRIELYLKSTGYLTYYGSTKLRLHPGSTEGGEDFGTVASSVEQHNVDSTSHTDIREAISSVKSTTLEEVNTIISNHRASEETARNQAIATAIAASETKIKSEINYDIATQVGLASGYKEEAFGFRNDAEEFRDDAETFKNNAESAANNAKSAANSISNVQSAVSNIAVAVARQAEVCAAAQSDVVAKTVEVRGCADTVSTYAEEVRENAVAVSDDLSTVSIMRNEVAENAEAVEKTLTEVTSLKYATDANADATAADALTCAGFVNRLAGMSDDVKSVLTFANVLQGKIDTVEGYVKTVDALAEEADDAKEGAETAQSFAEGFADNASQSASAAASHVTTSTENKNATSADALTCATLVDRATTAALEATTIRNELSDALRASQMKCVYDSEDIGTSNVVILSPDKKYYFKPIYRGRYLISIDSSNIDFLNEEVISFRLCLRFGDRSFNIAFDSNIILQEEPVYYNNGEAMFEIISTDGGLTWIAQTVYTR